MNIREYVEKDIELLREIYNESTRMYNFPDFNEEQKKIMIVPHKLYMKLILQKTITLVLEDDKDMIQGFISVEIEGHEYPYITLFYVNLNSINKGYGRKLFEEMLRKLKSMGKNKVYLHASEYSLRIELYEKFGFERIGYEDVSIGFHDNKVIFNWMRMEREI